MGPLHAAAEIDNLEAFTLLRNSGGQVNICQTGRDNPSRLPIHIAAFQC